MTQEDINEVVTKSMPQWKKDQFDAIYANADYIEWLRRRIERLEEKLKSHNKDYAAAQEIWCDYKESNMDVQYPFFDDYCKMRLNSQK